jgi:PST family polysaccharide transporter
VALPAFSRLQHETERLKQAFVMSVYGASLLSFPVFFLFAAVAPEFFEVVYGAKWLDSAPVAQVLAFIGVLHTAALFNPPIIKAKGKANWEFRLSFINAIGNVGGFLIGAQFGIEGVALAFVLWGYVFTPVELYFVHKLVGYDVPGYIKKVSRSFVAGLSIAAVVWLFGQMTSDLLPAWARLAIMIPMGFAGHYLFVRYIAGLSVTDLKSRLRKELSALDD